MCYKSTNNTFLLVCFSFLFRGKLTRILRQFTPHSWMDFAWKPTSSLGRWLGMLVVIAIVCILNFPVVVIGKVCQIEFFKIFGHSIYKIKRSSIFFPVFVSRIEYFLPQVCAMDSSATFPLSGSLSFLCLHGSLCNERRLPVHG